MDEEASGPGSLETRAEAELEHDRVDDHEAALDELIRQFGELADDLPETPLGTEEFVREDEFVCRSCHLVLHRSHLADRRRVLCLDCSGERRTVPSGREGGGTPAVAG